MSKTPEKKSEKKTNEDYIKNNEDEKENDKTIPQKNKLLQALKYSNINQDELENHLQLIKKWLIRYNSFELDNQSAGKLSRLKLNVEDINIILNHKINFTRVKLFIDYLELENKCPNFAFEFKFHFINYQKYVKLLIRKILISSKKIKDDTVLFNDILLLNYPFINGKITHDDILEIIHRKEGIISFGKCYVIKVNESTNLLWSKKIFPKCECEVDKYKPRKFFNIFSKNIKYNNAFSRNPICSKCHMEYFHDIKSDIYIECQEIQIVIDTDCDLINNKITVWTFGDLINCVKEGNCISLNAYYIPENINTLEKKFDFGYCIALNFDMYFNPLSLINPKNFKKNYERINDILSERINGIHFNKNDKEKKEDININNILDMLQFQRQFQHNFYKFLIQNYVFFKRKEINNLSIIKNSFLSLPIINENYFPFLNLILDLSIVQRDYYNHIIKLGFFQNSNENEENEEQINSMEAIQKSRNIVFKSKFFNNQSQINNNNINNIPQNIISNPNNFLGSMNNKILKSGIQVYKSNIQKDIKKYFNINPHLNYDILTKPINLFLIFDNTKNDPLYNIMIKYHNNLYPNLITVYPFFNTNKFDKQSILNFLYINNNKIILIPNIDFLSKNEIDILNSIMENMNVNSEEMDNFILNISFWFCCSANKLNDMNNNSTTNKKNKEGMFAINNNFSYDQLKIKNFDNILHKCELIFSFSKRNLKIKNNIDLINEKNINNYLIDSNIQNLNDDRILELYNHFQYFNEKIKVDCGEDHLFKEFNNSFDSAKLIENYFISKEQSTKITFDDLFTLLRIAIFTSMLRNNYENKKIILPTTISNINYLDSFFAILIYENVICFKYGMEFRSFDNLIDEIIFYDYNTLLKDIIDNLTMNQKRDDNNYFFDKNIPKSKTLRKINFTENEYDNPIQNMNLKEKNICELCQLIDKIDGIKLFDFLGKLNNLIK